MRAIELAIVLLVGVTFIATSVGAAWSFKPNYTATFSGDLAGQGRVKVTGSFLSIVSEAATWDFALTFGSGFGEFTGTHSGVIEIRRDSSSDSTSDLTFTYPEGCGPPPLSCGPQSGTYYQLKGVGAFAGSTRQGWFRISSLGEYILLKYDYSIGSWVVVWTGNPDFVVEGRKL